MKDNLDRLEVLGDIYHDLKRTYPSKKELDLAKIKMQIIKKEMLLLCYSFDQEIDKIC